MIQYAFVSHRVMFRAAAKSKQRCYLEIVVRFNRDIPTLVASSRVPEQTQLDTYVRPVGFYARQPRQLSFGNSCRAFAFPRATTAKPVTGSVAEKITENFQKRLPSFCIDSDHLQGKLLSLYFHRYFS